MMMKYTEQAYMTPLNASMEIEDPLAPPISQEPRVSLTLLWEYVIRAQSLPESLDLGLFFETIHERLRDPEWEVRQHALRVLVDFIPLIPKEILDEKIELVLGDLVANLGHLGPAVRKGAVDSLRAYVNHTTKINSVIRDLVEKGIEKSQENKVHTNVVLGIILSLPFLINNKLSDETITYTIHRLLDKIVKVIHQETVLRALLRIREIIGYDRFNDSLITHDSYNSKKEFDLLCEVYDLHTFRNSSRASFRHGSFGSFGGSSDNERFTQYSNQSPARNQNYNHDYNHNKTILKTHKVIENNVTTYVKTEDVIEEVPKVFLDDDKVILETEIQLQSGPAITMKIHEESSAESDEDRHRTFKVLPDDSDGDDYEHLRRTPRRVRFGGEIVKLRTPDSDSNNLSDDNDATISIISGENGDKPVIEIKYVENETRTTTRTTRSLIPIPLKQTQSEPNSPIRPNLHRSKLYKSSPNLSRTRKSAPKVYDKSRIPRRYNTEIKKSVETKIQIKISDGAGMSGKGKKVESKISVFDRSKGSTQEKIEIKSVKEVKPRTDKSRDKFESKLPSKSRVEQNVLFQDRTESNTPQLDKPKDNIKPKPKIQHPKKEEYKVDKPVVYNPVRRNSREDEFSPVPIHNEIEVLHNLTRSPSPSMKYKKEHDDVLRDDDDDDDDSRLPDISVTQKVGEIRKSNTATSSESNVNRVTHSSSKRPTSEKPMGQRISIESSGNYLGTPANPIRPPSKGQLDYTSFQVYNSSLSDSFYEFADSPIPTKDSGECLTCSSSGSDTAVIERKRLDNFSVLDERIVDDLQNMEDVRARQRGLEELLRVIQNPNVMDSLQDRLPTLLYILFTAEQQPILQPIAEQTLSILFTSMNQQSLVSRLQQISLSLSKMGSPLGVRLAILLMRRIPPGLLVDQLLADPILGAKSSKVREGALQILMTVSRFFPSTDLNIPKSAKSVVATLRDKKRKVRQAALEALAALAQLSSPSTVLEAAHEVTSDWSDRDQILRVIRTRLSRKQLPAVNMNGNIRYSSPTGESEIDWLSRGTGSPQSSGKSGRKSARKLQDNNNNEDAIVHADVLERRRRFYSTQTETVSTNGSSSGNERYSAIKGNYEREDVASNRFVVLENSGRFIHVINEDTFNITESFTSEYNGEELPVEEKIDVDGYSAEALDTSQEYNDTKNTNIDILQIKHKPSLAKLGETQDTSFNVSEEQVTEIASSSDANKTAPLIDATRNPGRYIPDNEKTSNESSRENRLEHGGSEADSAKQGGSNDSRYVLEEGADSFEGANTSATGGRKVSYWRSNLRRQMLLGDNGEEIMVSDWSRDSLEEPAGRAPTTQIWAIDPSSFGSSEKLSTSNGSLRQIYLVKNNESKTAATNTAPHDYREGATNTTPVYRKPASRGRSFSPPNRNGKQSDYDSYEEQDSRRFVRTSYKREVQRIRREERVRKSYSSEHLSNVERLRKEEVASSGSSSGSSARQTGNWHRDLRSGIPVPIQSDTKLRIRNRSSYKPKGPLSIPYYPPVKSPSPQTTPEKFTLPEQPHIIGRQPFSSGSESSGYFTPPPEPTTQAQTPEVSPQPSPQTEHRTPTAVPERFIQIETPKRSVENFTVIDSEPETLVDDEEEDDDEEEEEDEIVIESVEDDPDEPDEPDERQEPPQPKLFERKSTSNSLNEFELRENRTAPEPTMSKSATNSLDEPDFTHITFSEKHALSKSEVDIKISTHITRKNVSSAPSLNEIVADFQTYEDATPPKTSLPGSMADSLEETEAPEELFRSSPQKQCTRKVLPKSSVKRKSSRIASTNLTLYPDTLRPFTKPREAFHEIVEQLESPEWETTMKGLQGMVRMIRHHKEAVENQMHTVCVLLGKQIRNLRSQVARAACLVASELFNISKRPLEMEVDELAGPLLHRTADTNKFLRSDANAALDEMSSNLSVPKVVSVVTLRGSNHQNAVVRSAAARLLCNIVHRLGPEKVFQLPRDTRDKILLSGANMLTEGSLETRKHAKMLLGDLGGHSQFQRALTEAVPTSVLRHIDKTLRTLMK